MSADEYQLLLEKEVNDGSGAFNRVEAQSGENFVLANQAATSAREKSQQRACERYAHCKP